jgi:peptide chain release factor subunit 3
MPMVARKLNAPLMMPISEKYKDMGTIVVGKVESGLIKKGETLTLMPNKDVVEVFAIYNEIEEEVSQALCGDNVRIRLRGVEDEDISPGFVLTSPTRPVHAVRHFEAQLAILEHKSIICAGYSAVMHIHTLAEEVTLSVSSIYLARSFVALLNFLLHRPCFITSIKLQAVSQRNPRNLQRKVSELLLILSRGAHLQPFSGQKIVALIETAAAVCVERFSDYPQLGRFTLRDEGRTIAIGKVCICSFRL